MIVGFPGKCEVGNVSENGLEPCFPCPYGYYQNSVGQSSCFKCKTPTSTTTIPEANNKCPLVSCTMSFINKFLGKSIINPHEFSGINYYVTQVSHLMIYLKLNQSTLVAHGTRVIKLMIS